VISLMASGMDMTNIITRKIKLEEVPKYIENLRTDKSDCKVTCIMD